MFNKMDSDVTKLFPKEHRKQLLWKIQRDHVLNKRNQWNPEFLDVCLQLWQRSKQGYADLKDSGFLKLPSERLLQYKKNTVNQRPGLHTEVFEWMNKEAEQQRGSVQLRRVGDEFEIAGLVDMGDFYHSMQSLQTGEYGFFSHACLCDGGQANRDFIKGHFGSEENAIAKKFTINNLYGEGSYSFIMDPPHNIKKLRNNLEKSTVTGTARCFKTRGQNILWAHLKEAYLHDKTNARAPLISCKIRDGHFQLTPATRMRNHLASDVFSDDMLELLDNYQEFKRHQKGDDDSMSLTREYISAGNEFVQIFANTKPIRTMDDPRLMRLDAALHWFLDWKQDVMDSVNLTSKERNKSYISEKLHFDLCSMVFGFKSYIHTMTSQFPGMGLVAGHTNQDALENMFGCIRASNGSNTNPTVLQYGPSVNGYIHCRSFKVRNGNSARKN
ncbi:Hypp9552 [Branchiostoma lanceolatum]|uniref:Hypp9552 protein n=1 Tax=Branchiostoma lanceolatum TaxID=7740 RepID=A0A8S4MN02_BRALA|nr:Hypp9552 [Branchiostoma lanceolatum]